MRRLFYVLLILNSFPPEALCQCHGSQVYLLEEVLNALEKVLKYVESNVKLMNVDATFGLVLGQAHIQSLKIINKYKSRINNISNKITKLVEETKRFLQPSEKNLIFLNTILNVNAWIKNITFKSFEGDLYQNYKIDTFNKYIKLISKSSFDESSSDECILNLLKQENCCSEHYCNVSPNCYTTMRIKSKFIVDPAYGVTHSLLFLQMARSQQCLMNNTILNIKIQQFCSYILWELNQNVDYGFIAALDDLLLEQVTLCGYEGYKDFLTYDIIEYILSIQQSSGCFSMDDENRVKRESNYLPGKCIDHTTGLGVSTLSLILRYLLYMSCDYD